MRRFLLLLIFFLFAKLAGHSQLINNGGKIIVASGASIRSVASITNINGGIIQNAGLISTEGDFRNEQGGVLSSNIIWGRFETAGNFINNGNSFSGLKLRLFGDADSDTIRPGPGSDFDTIQLAKGFGFVALLADNTLVTGGVRFDNPGNYLQLGNASLRMGPLAVLENTDDSRFIVTNGSGCLTKQQLGSVSFLFPVGYSASEFNPINISNNGLADDISVRCFVNVLDHGATGSLINSDFANNAWSLTEAIPGGSDLSLTAYWDASDELSGFNRIKSGIAQYAGGTDWDLPADKVGLASGSGYFQRVRSGLNSTGIFAIADLDKVNTAKLGVRVFLQGAYGGSGLMKDNLRAGGLVPIVQPYDASMGNSFTRLGVFDGSTTVNERIPGLNVLDVSANQDDIVDWIFVAIQDSADPSVRLQTKAALLQRDGDIVEYDSASGSFLPLRMPINSEENYYLVVAHRNHLAIRSSAPVHMTKNVLVSYDFTLSQSQAYQNPAITTNTAMIGLATGVFGMWGGNANCNNSVRGGGPAALNDYVYLVNTVLLGNTASILSGVYAGADMNMDGVIRAGGPAAINDYVFLVNTILQGNIAKIISQH